MSLDRQSGAVERRESVIVVFEKADSTCPTVRGARLRGCQTLRQRIDAFRGWSLDREPPPSRKVDVGRQGCPHAVHVRNHSNEANGCADLRPGKEQVVSETTFLDSCRKLN